MVDPEASREPVPRPEAPSGPDTSADSGHRTEEDAGTAAGGANRVEPPVVRPEPSSTPATGVAWWSWLLLALVFAMHVLNEADVWLMVSVLPKVRGELALDETQVSWLPTVLLVGAAVAAPLVGYLADRYRRSRLMAIGMAVWSLAVVSTGMARSYDQIEAARAAAGAGAAAATVLALTLLADAFPRRMRGRVFAAFWLAMPAGAALGLFLNAAVPRGAGWQELLLAVGAPGLGLALLALALPEPVRGASEPVDERRLRLHEYVGPSNEDYIDLMVNSSFNYSLFGMAFSAFALAGLAYWLPEFLAARGVMRAEQAGPFTVLLLLAAAGVGTLAGGWLADAFAFKRPGRLFLIPGVAMLGAIVAVLTVVYGRVPRLIGSGIFLAEGAVFLVVVPCYTILAGVTMPNMRGVGFGVALATRHVLGDLWSPTLMGWVIDTFGQRDAMATVWGQLLAAIGAVPVLGPGREPENLRAGMLVVLPALLIAGVVFLAGIRHVHREFALMIAKLRALPSRRAS